MFRIEAKEAVPIVNTVLDALLSWTATRGRTGADLRAACGQVKANAESLLANDLIARPLINCYELARAGGITFKQMDHVRNIAAQQEAKSVGATLTKNTLIQLALMIMGKIIAVTVFTTRQDVIDYRSKVNDAFETMEELMADEMDAMMFRAITGLHGAISLFLYDRARPLPRMLNFRFNMPLPTLVLAHKLYADAGRADELRIENQNVHPTFMRPYGRALSA